MTHKITAWKKNMTVKDHVAWITNPSPAHLNFLHEVASQHLGYPPSGHWGFQKVPFRIKAEPHVWDYLRTSASQPAHVFARRMLQHSDTSKKAAGVGSSIAEMAGDAASAIGRYGRSALNTATNVLQTVARHSDEIHDVIGVGTALAGLGSTIGTIAGAITPETNDAVQSHVQAQAKRKKKPKKGGWIDFDDFTIGDQP